MARPAPARAGAPTGSADARQETPSQCSTVVVQAMAPPEVEHPGNPAIQTSLLLRTTSESPPSGTVLSVHCSPLKASASALPVASVPRIQTTPDAADAM